MKKVYLSLLMVHIVRILRIAHILRTLHRDIKQMNEDVITFNADVFSLETIKRALYRFSDKCSFDIQVKDKVITVQIQSKLTRPAGYLTAKLSRMAF